MTNKYSIIKNIIIICTFSFAISLAFAITSFADVLSENVRVEGYQASATVADSSGALGGIRTVASVEKQVDGEDVVQFGQIIALANYATESEMTVDSTSAFVNVHYATEQSILDVVMGPSKTATYYAQTMCLGNVSKEFFAEPLKIRSFAVLENGEVRYSEIYSYTVYNVADYLYKNRLMSTKNGHDFLYNRVLKPLNPDYVEVDYDWSAVLVPTFEDYHYYSSLELAIADANEGTTENADATFATAKVKMEIKDGKAFITVLDNLSDVYAFKLSGNIDLQLNKKTVTMQTGRNVLVEGDVDVHNGSIVFDSITNGLIVNDADLEMTNTSVEISSENVEDLFGVSARNSSNVTLNNCHIKNIGKRSGCAVIAFSESNVHITGGTYEKNPVFSGSSGDSYGHALYAATGTTLHVDETNGTVNVKGGNSGILASCGSNVVIDGGTFESPNHGGIYCATGSSGTFEINGGTFKNNWNTSDQDVVKDIVPYGGGYFGTDDTTSDEWSIDIKNATFIGGKVGIMQKSNNSYIPPSILLYNTSCSGSNADISNQNNPSGYHAFFYLMKNTVLKHNNPSDKIGGHIIDCR
ncbi:MAG: right-handed parallel beta-helix repeat-containing protein [Eubacterium sp.]|nr:right-handed parallel beta-helix repeat-containing protein [Eubacterium sp.]